MAKKATTKKSGAVKAQLTSRRGKGAQPESAIHKEHKPGKVSSRRVSGAQRSAQRRQQKRRDSKQHRPV
jgi:hypothetical protein